MADSEPRTLVNPVTGERMTSITRGPETGGAHVEGRGYLPVGWRPPGIHRHPHQDERLTVVSGALRVTIGKERRELAAGESAVLPRGVWHDFEVIGDGPAETIVRAEPALGLEMILATLVGLAKDGKTNKHGLPYPLQGAVIGQFYAEVAQFKKPPPAVQKVVLPALAALGKRRGYRPYYEHHFEPGELDAILDAWAAHRPWAGNRRPTL